MVTTINSAGVVNAAPFSMFNMMGEAPPILMLSINKLKEGHLKDTFANILANGEFVVHIADEPMAEQMHACGESLPMHESEVDKCIFALTLPPIRTTILPPFCIPKQPGLRISKLPE